MKVTRKVLPLSILSEHDRTPLKTLTMPTMRVPLKELASKSSFKYVPRGRSVFARDGSLLGYKDIRIKYFIVYNNSYNSLKIKSRSIDKIPLSKLARRKGDIY